MGRRKKRREKGEGETEEVSAFTPKKSTTIGNVWQRYCLTIAISIFPGPFHIFGDVPDALHRW